MQTNIYNILKKFLLKQTHIHVKSKLNRFVGISAPEAFLVVAAESEVITLSLDPNSLSAPVNPVTNLSGAVAVDFDYENNHVYFSQVLGRKLSRFTVGSDQVTDIVDTVNITCKYLLQDCKNVQLANSFSYKNKG